MKEKLTRWFPPDVNPTRVGVYETATSNPPIGKWFQYWDGKKWGGWTFSRERALQLQNYVSSAQTVFWRGLASDPNA